MFISLFVVFGIENKINKLSKDDFVLMILVSTNYKMGKIIYKFYLLINDRVFFTKSTNCLLIGKNSTNMTTKIWEIDIFEICEKSEMNFWKISIYVDFLWKFDNSSKFILFLSIWSKFARKAMNGRDLWFFLSTTG